ncbi:helix-turn-helix transcriptional regulator [Ruegeria arenilitoris]|uniref:helix-turn-helix transcriptional regulator n=1 Tax=Ruegeria arenilitoris TaxID=1173585 RepID=UPI00147C0DC2|nr:helix-turn-helix domain-containing protein [Ruegeria arenilitoris]
MTVKFLTVDEKCQELNVSRQTLMRWRKNGTGPQYVIYGGTIRYLPEEVANA